MPVTGNKILQQQNLIDESFRSDRPESYDLFIYSNEEEVSVVVAERDSKKFIGLESFELMVSENQEDYSELLEEISNQSLLLKPGSYRRVIICSGFNCSTFIPNPLYDPSTAEDHLRFSQNYKSSDELMTDSLKQVEARNVFAIPSAIYTSLSRWYPGAEFHHTTTALTDYLLSVHKNSEEEMMTVMVHQRYIEIIVTKGKDFLLCNNYNYESPEELVYYILFVCEQLHLNPEIIELKFAGIISLTDSAYMLTRKYIRNTGMVTRPENYSYSFLFNTLPPQFHYNLFCQLICAS
jgi:hypothetical protein